MPLSPLIASWFGLGLVPLIGSSLAVALVVGLYLLALRRWWVFAGLAGLVAGAGLLAAEGAGVAYGTADDSRIIIDEVAGAMFALVVGRPVAPLSIVVLAALYLVLDAVKPWPLTAIEDMHGGIGVMGDDLAAGLLVGLAVLALRLSGLPARLRGR